MAANLVQDWIKSVFRAMRYGFCVCTQLGWTALNVDKWYGKFIVFYYDIFISFFFIMIINICPYIIE